MQETLEFDSESGLIAQANFIESLNCDERPKDTKVDTLVIHAISLPPDCYGGNFVAQLFTNQLDQSAHPYFLEIAGLKVSSHFYIERQGELTQFVSTHQRAWHAGVSEFDGRAVVNNFSIGVELEGCDSDEFTDAQYHRLIALTRCLQSNYPLIGHNRIVGHSDISPGRKTDPGPCFDWDKYKSGI